MRNKIERVAGALALGAALSACAAESGDDARQAEDLVEGHTQALAVGPQLIATGVLDQATDFAPFHEALENGNPQNILGGIGSGLCAAGGTTFVGIPDRGPNAVAFANGAQVDNTTSYISRFETLDLKLSPASSGALPFTLVATLKDTTLLYSETALAYGSTPNLPSGTPIENEAGKFYFTGRSDNFSAGLSTNPAFARLDPEGVVVSNDGNSVFIADEYGPYVYQFDRLTGRRLRAYTLPTHFAITNLNSVGALEISGNTSGRVTNKGMEGLTITPDGATLVGLMQSPLLQDGGDGGRANRIVTIDVASGATHEYVYDNLIGTKAYNSSEIIALNDHQFLIDTRDGKGLGDGAVAVVKQLWAVDIANATDVSNLSGATTLLAYAAPKKRFLDVVAVLNANNIPSTQIPAKLEGLAFGQDVLLNGVLTHTLYVANDNDFVANVAGPSRWFVFGFTDDDLAAIGFSYTPRQITERGSDVALQQSPSATSVITGSSVSFALDVTNTGLVPANVTLSESLAPGLTLSSCSPAGACTTQANGATISLGRLAGDASQGASVSAVVGCSVADGSVLASRAVASLDGSDPTPEDDSSTVTITALNPAPTVANVTLSQSQLWPPNNKLVPITVGYDVSDNCAGTRCSLSIASSEPISEYGYDWTVVDDHHVQLRATRLGGGSGRTYEIAIRCVDSGGATSVASTSVRVDK